MPWIASESCDAGCHSSLGQAPRLQDSIGPCAELRYKFKSEAMDFFPRKIGSCASANGVPAIGLTVRKSPHSCIRCSGRQSAGEQISLAMQCGINLRLNKGRGARLPIARYTALLRPAHEGCHEFRLRRRKRRQHPKLGEAGFQPKIRRNNTLCEVRSRSCGLLVQHFSKCREAPQVGLCIIPRIDRMLRGEKCRHVAVSACQLRHNIRHCHADIGIALWEAEAFQRGGREIGRHLVVHPIHSTQRLGIKLLEVVP